MIDGFGFFLPTTEQYRRWPLLCEHLECMIASDFDIAPWRFSSEISPTELDMIEAQLEIYANKPVRDFCPTLSATTAVLDMPVTTVCFSMEIPQHIINSLTAVNRVLNWLYHMSGHFTPSGDWLEQCEKDKPTT